MNFKDIALIAACVIVWGIDLQIIIHDFRQAYKEVKEKAKKERNIDADKLIRRIEEKAKMSKNEDVINGLCGAVAIIYDLLIEDGLEKVDDE